MAHSFIRVKNWDDYQHYKDRHAPWIKFYGNMLTSHWWVMGSDASKLLAICIMALAQRTDNKIPNDPSYIKRFSHIDQDIDLAPLCDAQFIEFINENELVQDASNVLAECKQRAPRIEENREDKTITRKPDGFAEFWSAYPKKVGKGDAEKAWSKSKPDLDLVLAAIKSQSATDQWRKDGGQFIPNPGTWIRQKRWEDGGVEQAAPKLFDNKAWLKELLS